MTAKSHEQIARTVGPPRNEDRCTVILQAHYLEWEIGGTTDVRWSYDRLAKATSSPQQFDIRVNPGARVPVSVPGMVPGRIEYLLGHKLPQLSTDNEMFKEQQAKNVIQVYADGVHIADIKPNRMFFGEFKGVLEVACTNATALLHVTALPA